MDVILQKLDFRLTRREGVDERGNPREPTQADFENNMARYVFWGMGPPENPQEPGNPET